MNHELEHAEVNQPWSKNKSQNVTLEGAAALTSQSLFHWEKKTRTSAMTVITTPSILDQKKAGYANMTLASIGNLATQALMLTSGYANRSLMGDEECSTSLR